MAAGLLALAATVRAGSTVTDRVEDRDYLLTMRDGAPHSVPLLLTLHGMRFEPKDDQANLEAPTDKIGWAMANLDVDYTKIVNEKGLDDMWDAIETIVKEIERENPQVDPARIYLIGTSRGGMMGLALALRHPDTFSAVGLASASYLLLGSEKKLDGAKGQAFFFVNGDKDDILPILNQRNTKIALRKHGAVVASHVHVGAGHVLAPEDYVLLINDMAKYGRQPAKARK
jgi:predicted peptidase